MTVTVKPEAADHGIPFFKLLNDLPLHLVGRRSNNDNKLFSSIGGPVLCPNNYQAAIEIKGPWFIYNVEVYAFSLRLLGLLITASRNKTVLGGAHDA